MPPPPPKITHNNERSMIQCYTRPEFPKNLAVVVTGDAVPTVTITWDQLDRAIDGFKIIYTLSVTEMKIDDKDKCKSEENNTIIAGNIPEACKYTIATEKTYATSENHLELSYLTPKALYKFKVNVRTPYGDSDFSPPIIKEIEKSETDDADTTIDDESTITTPADFV